MLLLKMPRPLITSVFWDASECPLTFIIVWKVARLLVIPKNITKGLNRP